MSKERLEEIEKLDVSLLEGTKFHEHWLWLIEQWYLSDGAFSSLDSEYVDCVEQNKRYREALSLLNRVAAADYKSYIDTDANFVVDVTSEALESELNA